MLTGFGFFSKGKITGQRVFFKEKITGQRVFLMEKITGQRVFLKEKITGQKVFLKEKITGRWLFSAPQKSGCPAPVSINFAPSLRFVCNWLKANKISLNASKTEMLVFRDPRKKIDFELKIKIDGKKIIASKFVKYLGIYLDNHLSWQKQEQDMRSRLSRAAGMLCKIRHYVNFDTLKMVYYGIFASILNYGSLVWGQHSRIVKEKNGKISSTLNFIFKTSKPRKLYIFIVYNNTITIKITSSCS